MDEHATALDKELPACGGASLLRDRSRIRESDLRWDADSTKLAPVQRLANQRDAATRSHGAAFEL
jgi:hypothetical protein